MSAPSPGTIRFKEIASSPGTPDPGYASLYIKTDNILYIKDSSGVETALGSASSITALTGDVSAIGPGSAASMVNFVGGQAAATVAVAVVHVSAATAANTANQLVQRNASGDFSAGIITASLNGNATTATSATTAIDFTGTLAGDVTGTQFATAISNTTVTSKLITGFISSPGVLSASDSILIAIEKLDGNIGAVTGSAITDLTGDVTATGPGSSVAAVAFVGGQTAADVSTSVNDTQAATTLNTPSTIVKRDGSGDFAVGLINGVAIEAHASRHLPSGADPLTTAAPTTNLDSTTTNGTGSANSLSKSDHSHAISTGIAITQTPDQANSAGISPDLAKADHVHNIPSGTPVQIGTANFVGAAASLALSDHVHSHGNQTSTSLHALATGIAHGFMSSTDKTKLDAATALNTPSTLVFRDSSGDFAATMITSDLTGNVTGNLTGNVTGNATNVTGIVATVNGGTGVNGTATFPTSGVVVTEDATENLTNKTISGTTNTVVLIDTKFTLQDNGDNTRQAVFQLSGISTGTTRTYSLPDTSDQLATAQMTTAFKLNVFALTDAATIALDASLANVYTVTLAGNRTLAAPTSPTNGQKIVIRVKQDGTGNRTLTLDPVFRFGSDVSSYTASTLANKEDYIGAIYNGDDSKWDVLAIVKGYN